MLLAESSRNIFTTCRRRYIVLFVALTILFVFYVFLNLRNYGLYTGNHPFFAAQPCEYLNEIERGQLLDMALDVHKILDGFGMEHWLMYGSVFGAVRAKGPLPWDNDVDIGFTDQELLHCCLLKSLPDPLKRKV